MYYEGGGWRSKKFHFSMGMGSKIEITMGDFPNPIESQVRTAFLVFYLLYLTNVNVLYLYRQTYLMIQNHSIY